MNEAILIDQVSKKFRKSPFSRELLALDNISLTVEQGEVFGFVGQNGAGKSTTIKILVGILTASSGAARVFGHDVNSPLARAGMGYVPENPLLYDYLTPMEVLTTGLRLHQVKVVDERAHCLSWLERFGIANVADQRIRSFSKGMMQRTALAHALAIQPRLLILDEPLSGLDPIGRREVVDILEEYRKGGGTLFFSSHVLHDVERLADRFGVIHRGELVALRSPNDLVGGEQYVTVRTLGSAPLEGFQQEAGDRWLAEVRRENLWQALGSAQAAGHTLVEVRPTLSLESAFLRFVESGNQPRETGAITGDGSEPA